MFMLIEVNAVLGNQGAFTSREDMLTPSHWAVKANCVSKVEYMNYVEGTALFYELQTICIWDVFAMAGSRRDGLEDSKDDSQWCYAAGTMWTAFREDYKGKRVEKQCALIWLEPAWEEQSSCCTTCGASPVQILKLSLFEYLQSALLGKKVICAAGSALQFLV